MLKKKFWFATFLAIILFAFSVLPAAAICDDCIAAGEEPASHCPGACDGTESTEPCDCGDTYVLEWCSAEHDYCDGCGVCMNEGDCECATVDPEPDEPEHEHNYYEDITYEGDCQTDGYTLYVCDCGDSYTVSNGIGYHSWSEPEVVAPTCTEQGYTHDYCMICGETDYYSYVDALGHNNKNVAAVAATCTTEGSTAGTLCSRCGYTTVTKIAALQHKYTTSVISPSCTSDGWTIHECNRCDYYYTSDHVAALGHNMIVTSTVEPTCTAKGQDNRSCSRCGETDVVVLDKLGHDPISVAAVAATCTKAGNTAGVKCSRCSYTTVSTIAKLGHDYTSKTTTSSYLKSAATCTAKAKYYYKCLRCTAKSTSVYEYGAVNASNHTGEEVKGGTAEVHSKYSCCGAVISATHTYTKSVYEAATCTAKGTSKYQCSCGYSYTKQDIASLGHNYIAETHQATCTTGGWTFHECSRCGSYYTSGETEPLGHDPKTVSVTQPTCTADGRIDYACSRCGETSVDILSALGHSYTVTEEVVSTCTVQGYIKNKCARCDDYVIVEDSYKPLAAHSWVNTTRDEPSCTAAGIQRMECSVCGDSQAEPVPATGHAYKATVTAPSCDTGGWTTHTCANCGDSYADTETDPLGHDFKTVKVTQATCTTAGQVEEVCSRCGDSSVQNLPATGHNFTTTESIDSTCDSAGYVVKICSKCDFAEIIEDSYKPLAPHTWVSDGESVAATCQRDGWDYQHCSVCGDTRKATLEKLAHQYTNTVVVEPTHSTLGYTKKVCSLCNDAYEIVEGTYVDMLGHTWVKTGYEGPICTTEGKLTVSETDSSAFANKSVPLSSGSYARITEIGGMSYRVNTGTEDSPIFALSSSAVTEVIGLDINGDETGRFVLPEEVFSLDSYGEGYDSSRYNRILVQDGKFIYVQYVKKVVFDGTENWKLRASASGETERNYVSLTIGDYGAVTTKAIICSHYETKALAFTNTAIGAYVLNSNGYNAAMITIRPWNGITDIVEWKSYLADQYDAETPVTAVYVLAEPVITDVTHLFDSEALLNVASGGSIVFQNEDGNDMPNEVVFYNIPTDCETGHYYDDANVCILCGTTKPRQVETYECSECGETKVEEVSGADHVFEVHVNAATCDTPGNTVYECTVCGLVYADAITTALGHDPKTVSVTQPTCTADGRIDYACSRCGETSIDVLTALGHSYTVTEEVASTCTVQGYIKNKCARCDDYVIVEDSYKPLVAHSWVNTTRDEPSCTAVGIQRMECSVCGDSQAEPVPATGHAYKATVTAPSCDTGGWTTHTCANCGDSYVDTETDPVGHDFEVENTNPATCATDGQTDYVCSACGETSVEKVAAFGHDYSIVESVESTCDSMGYTQKICAVCGENMIVEDSYKPLAAHSWSNTTRDEPTCVAKGTQHMECSVCGETQAESIPAIGHAYEASIIAPTCDTGGWTTYTCSRCDDSYDADPVGATGHSYIAINTVQPTCSVNGKIESECSICGETSITVLNASGHSYSVIHVVAPTCEEPGYTKYTCAQCNDFYTADETAMISHTWEESDRREPTCTDDGYVASICKNCKEEQTVVVAANGHKFISGICSVCGFDASASGDTEKPGETEEPNEPSEKPNSGGVVIGGSVGSDPDDKEINTYLLSCAGLVFGGLFVIWCLTPSGSGRSSRKKRRYRR